MAYERYFKRNGKKFGPYYYESYRDKNGKVKKKYIGTVNPDKAKSISTTKVSKNTAPKRNLLIIGSMFLLLAFLFFSIYMSSLSSNISGYVISESVEQEFNTESADLEIRQPAKNAFGKAINKNKNKRMEFDLEKEKIILYFDLLNYSEFVEEVAISSINETIVSTNETAVASINNTEDIEEEPESETVVESTNETINETIVEPTNETIEAATNETIETPTNETVEEIVNETVEDSIIEEPTNETEVIVEEIVVEEIVVVDPVVEDPDPQITGQIIIQSFIGLLGRAVGIDAIEPEETISQTVEFQEVKNQVEELNESDLEIIEEKTKVELDDNEFEIIVDETESQALKEENEMDESKPDYKWGYQVKLKDLKFMAKIDVTANNTISIYNSNSLQIGRNVLSFSDLVDAGYKIRFEKPLLEMDNETAVEVEIPVPTNTTNETLTDSTTTTNESVVEPTNDSTTTNETSSTNDTINETTIESTNETTEPEVNETIEESAEEPTNETETPTEESIQDSTEENTTTEEPALDIPIPTIIGGFFTMLTTPLSANASEEEIEDIQYSDTITIYIERDFTNNTENISVGDTIFLDPTLIIISITDAEHLDENKSYISNIYNETQAQDDIWSETINQNEYVRATFEQSLKSTNDITVYARSANNQTATIEVYLEGGNETIATIENITNESYYKTYLTNLGEQTSLVFDLKIVNASVDFDYIVDPAAGFNISFVSPTRANGNDTDDRSIEINVSIETAPDLNELKYNWNGTNYTIFNNSLVLMMNLDNNSALGENTTHVADLSNYSNNGTVSSATVNTTGCKYGNCRTFDGANDFINISDANSLDITDAITLEAWANLKGKVAHTLSSGGSNAWEYAGVSSITPTNASWSAASAGNKTSASTNDASRWETRLTTNHFQFDYQLYLFSVSTSATILNLTWIGYGENQTGYNVSLYIWNFTGSSWIEKKNEPLTSDGTLNLVETSASDYINASGNVYVMAAAKHYNYAPVGSNVGRTPSNGGTHGGSTTLYCPASDPENDTINYFMQAHQSTDCTGAYQDGTPLWQPESSEYISSGTGTISWHCATRDLVYLQNSGWGDCWVAYYSAPSSGSCPYLYLWNGTGWDFEIDLYGSGALAYKRGPKIAVPIPHRIYQLDKVVPVDGKIELRIMEDLDEIDYFDRLQLLSYTVPENTTFGISVPALGGDPDVPLLIHSLSTNLTRPVSAIRLDTNKSILEEIKDDDEKRLMINPDSNNFSYHTFQIDFGNISSYEQKKLVVVGESVFPKSKEGIERRKKFSPAQYIEVVNESGEWERVDEKKLIFSKPISFETRQAIDISNIFLTDNTTIRITYLYKTYINQIAFDGTTDLDLGEPYILDMNSVTMNDTNTFHNFNEDGGVPNYYEETDNSEYLSYAGNYTKYGDIKELLETQDDKFVIMSRGDQIIANFTYPTEEVPEGFRRLFIIDTLGYYKSNVSTVPLEVGALPFEEMTNYPYLENESYPQDAEHRKYQKEWNTRVCEKGKTYCYDANTGEIIKGSKEDGEEVYSVQESDSSLAENVEKTIKGISKAMNILFPSLIEKSASGENGDNKKTQDKNENKKSQQNDNSKSTSTNSDEELVRSLNTNYVELTAIISTDVKLFNKEGAYELSSNGTNIIGEINTNNITSLITNSGYNHFVFTYDKNAGSNQQNIYINGELKSSGTLTDAITTNANSLYIGAKEGTSSFVEGEIDEVRVWNRTLTPSEVYESYVSNLVKYNANDWNFYINKSKNLTDVLEYGNYTYYATSVDHASAENSTETRSVRVTEYTKPTLTINSPLNQTYTNADQTITFNVTGADASGISTCWYSLNSGTTNVTMDNFAGNDWNSTNTSIPVNSNTVAFYCNDSEGNENSTNVTFTMSPSLELINMTTDKSLYSPNETIIFTANWQNGGVSENIRLLISSRGDFLNCNYTTTSGCIINSSTTTTSPVTATMNATSTTFWHAQVCSENGSCDKVILNPRVGSSVSLSSDDFTISSANTIKISADLNNDSIEDMFWVKDANVSVLYGKNSLYSGTLSTADVIAQANVTYISPNSISSVTTGDFNNDGFVDVFIGDSAYGISAGRGYIYYGNSSSPSGIVNTPDATLTARSSYNFFGESAATGDFNNDSIDDLLIGSINDNVHIILGPFNLNGTQNISLVENVTNITYKVSCYGAGIGDINGDSIDDMLCASGNSYGGPKGLYGSPTFNGTYSILGSYYFNSYLLDKVAISDINGDGYGDLMIAHQHATSPSGTNAGLAYVVYGSSSFSGSKDVTTHSNVIIQGMAGNDYLGYSIIGGDFNGDGYSDILVGAYGANSNYLFYGSSTFSGTYNATSANVTFNGVGGSTSVVMSGDFNGDNIDEAWISSPSTSYTHLVYTATNNATGSFSVADLPNVTIIYPLNTTYTSNITQLNYTVDELSGSCWYSKDSGATNLSVQSAGTNFTSVVSAEGVNSWTVYCNNSLGELGTDTLTFGIDTTAPQIDYTTGTAANTTNTSNDNIFVNVTITELNENTTVFNLYNSTGLVNSTPYTDATRSINWTGLPDGTYYYNVTANDTFSQTNSTATRTITLDSTFPLIDYTTGTPANVTNTTSNNIFVNVTVTEINEDAIVFNLYNSTSLVNSSTYTDATRSINWTGLSDGSYYYNVTVNDSVGNTNSTATRKLTVDTTNPLISFDGTTKVNTSNLSQTNIYAGVIVTEISEDTIVFNLYNTTGLVNSAPFTDATRTVNWLNLDDGIYYYNVTVNDSVGNTNSTETRRITLDTTNPLVDYGTGTAVDNGNLSQTYIYVNLSLTEINFKNATYTLVNGSGTTINTTTYTTGTEINWTGLSEGNYTYYVNITDWAENKNSTAIRTATLDTTSPVVILYPTGMPTNNSVGGESTFFNWSVTDNIDGNLSCYGLQGTTEFGPTYTLNNTMGSSTEILNGGQYNLRVRCYDDANNSHDSIDSVTYLVAAISFNQPASNNETIRTGDAQIFSVQETAGLAYLDNATVGIINETGTINRTLYLVESPANNWSYGYTMPSWEPQVITARATAFNNTVGSLTNVTSSRTMILLRVAGNTTTPDITLSCPNRTYLLNGSTANIQQIADLDTLILSRSIVVSSPNGTEYTLTPSSTAKNDNFFYGANSTFTINQLGTYTLTTNITDYESQTDQDVYTFYSVSGYTVRSINSSQITNLTVQDTCGSQQVQKGTDVEVTVPTGALFDINVSVVDTLHNISVLLRNVSITSNITEAVGYQELSNETSAPTDERNVAIFELNTTFNFTNYTLVFDYTAIAHTINDEANLKLWKCENITTCSLVNTAATINATLNTITVTLDSMSYFMVTETGIASVTVEVPTSGGGGGGGGTVFRTLNIITPGPIELGLNDEVLIPITIENPETVSLNTIKLSAISNTPDITPVFDITDIDKLGPGESKKVFLTLTSHSTPGEYDIDIYANVSNPKFTEKAKIFAKLVGTVGEKFIVERVVFAQDLFKENPICLELNDLLIRADAVMKEGKLDEGRELVQQAIYQCKDLIAGEQSPFNIIKPSEWKMPIIVILVFLVLALIVVMAIRRPKLNLFKAKKERRKLFRLPHFKKKAAKRTSTKKKKDVWN